MKTVGIIGCGQLAQLLAMSAYQLGYKTLCFAQEEECPAKRLSPLFIGKLSDVDAIKKFFEINSLDDLKTEDGFLKTRRFGYDGKGQVRVSQYSDLALMWNALDKSAIFERFVDFEAEVSQLVARNNSGDIQFFPLIKNRHQEGILRESQFADYVGLEKMAQDYARKLVESLNYVGVLAIEFFVHENQLIANEIAPRVHNSGHLTIEGCNVNQFEQHLRAIFNLPLIKPKIIQPVKMINIIGEWPQNLGRFSRVYNYGKLIKKNRKLGHGILVTQ